uniref:Uncharacterized protein n=1 Tax=Arundo donax TaxID=35708 RepID=A0A0A9B4D9_ARUDO
MKVSSSVIRALSLKPSLHWNTLSRLECMFQLTLIYS